MSRIAFTPIVDDRYTVLRLALDAAQLPTDDLTGAGRAFFELSDDAGPVGFIGIEGVGPDRLLRSLVVLPGRRRQGHGSLLVAHAEANAARQGAKRLHLLTTTMPQFFVARGYRVIARSEAPGSIRLTDQFSSLCPYGAAYLTKAIA